MLRYRGRGEKSKWDSMAKTMIENIYKFNFWGQLDRILSSINKTALLILVNCAHAPFFYNFMCVLRGKLSSEKAKDIQDRIVVLAAEDCAEKKIKSLFPNVKVMQLMPLWADSSGMHLHWTSLALGDAGSKYKQIAVMKAFMPFAAVALGYDVVVMDADVVWTENVFPELDILHHELGYPVLILEDNEKRGRGVMVNGGFQAVVSCRASLELFLGWIIQAPDMLNTGRNQVYLQQTIKKNSWNITRFSDISSETIIEFNSRQIVSLNKMFLIGKKWKAIVEGKLSMPWVFHANFARAYSDKKKMLQSISLWYLEKYWKIVGDSSVVEHKCRAQIERTEDDGIELKKMAVCVIGDPESFSLAHVNIYDTFPSLPIDSDYFFCLLSRRADSSALEDAVNFFKPVSFWYGNPKFRYNRRCNIDIDVPNVSKEDRISEWYTKTLLYRCCIDAVRKHEKNERFKYHRIARIRPDTVFYNSFNETTKDLMSYGNFSVFPMGKSICGSKPCINDYLAFHSRENAMIDLTQVDAYNNCHKGKKGFSGPVKLEERLHYLFDGKEKTLRLPIPLTLIEKEHVQCDRAGILDSMGKDSYDQRQCQICEEYFQQLGGKTCPFRYDG